MLKGREPFEKNSETGRFWLIHAVASDSLGSYGVTKTIGVKPSPSTRLPETEDVGGFLLSL